MFAVTINASPVGLIFAFLGGVVSILSPCVLPILPGLIGVVSGSTIEELEKNKSLGRKVLQICGLFSLGFSFVYVVIVLATSQLSQTFLSNSAAATRVGGIFLLIFALILAINQLQGSKFLSSEKRPFLKSGITDAGAVVTGAAFAFGWSPCIGPILGGVIAYASTEHALTARIAIVLSYCIGLCFAMSAIVYSSFRYKRFTKFLKNHMGFFIWTSISIMVVFGLVLVFNKMTWITAELTHWLDFFGLDGLVTIG